MILVFYCGRLCWTLVFRVACLAWQKERPADHLLNNIWLCLLQTAIYCRKMKKFSQFLLLLSPCSHHTPQRVRYLNAWGRRRYNHKPYHVSPDGWWQLMADVAASQPLALYYTLALYQFTYSKALHKALHRKPCAMLFVYYNPEPIS